MPTNPNPNNNTNNNTNPSPNTLTLTNLVVFSGNLAIGKSYPVQRNSIGLNGNDRLRVDLLLTL